MTATITPIHSRQTSTRSGTVMLFRSVDLPMTSFGRLPADADYEAQLVLTGDRCP